MRRTLLGGAGALLLLSLSACSQAIPGSALPAALARQTAPTSNSSPNGGEAASKLAAIDPCALLGQSELQRRGLSRREPSIGTGARSCSWGHLGQNGLGSFVIGADIRDHQGVKDINSDGYRVTDDPVGRHAARQAEDTDDGGGCFIAIGVTESSRVDVVAVTDAGKGCAVANSFAQLIEPLLPGGNG